MVATATPSLIPTRTYAGIATRGVALAVDAAVANVIFLLLAALIALISTLVGDLRPEWLVALLAAASWSIVVGGYFTLFWATTGQTPGMRLMQLRVISERTGLPPHLLRSLVRLGGLVLAIIPLGAGFLPVFFNERRRALQDMIARTVVIHVVP